MKSFKVHTINRHRQEIDGKGITTLIGLAGCPLQCKYCINKEMLRIHPIKEYTEDDLVSAVMIDWCYFIATGGGVTFGGGEPLLQSEMILKFMDILPENIKVNIETSLNCDNEYVEHIINYADELFIDIKSMKEDIYREYTGKSSELTRKWLEYIVTHNLQDKCVIRIPKIPNYTSKEDILYSVQYFRKMGFEKIDLFDYIFNT